jgi:Zn-dependent protease
MLDVQPAPDNADMSDPLWLQDALQGVFAIDDVTTGTMEGRATRVRGRFLIDGAEAYAQLAPRFRAQGRTLMVRHEGSDTVLLIVNSIIKPTPNNVWLPVILAIITVISVLFSYVLFWERPEPSFAAILRNLGKGWSFTLSLLSILLAHELGHYYMARRFGVAVTLPYFIPFPLSPFGTMGAMIRMKDIPPSKRAMLMIGAAGPISGLILAIPILILGLTLSEVTPLPSEGYSVEGNSLLYLTIKFLMFGKLLPSGGVDVFLHPVAFAGWAGLLVTSLNLIPASQLDGGHVAYALLGAKTRYLNWVVTGILLIMGIWWQGWLLWAVLIFAFSRVQVPPMDDVTPLAHWQIGLAIGLFILFALTFTPLPLRIVM